MLHLMGWVLQYYKALQFVAELLFMHTFERRWGKVCPRQIIHEIRASVVKLSKMLVHIEQLT